MILRPSKIKNINVAAAKLASSKSIGLGKQPAWLAHVFPARKWIIHARDFHGGLFLFETVLGVANLAGASFALAQYQVTYLET
jgi:hypothetical protein